MTETRQSNHGAMLAVRSDISRLMSEVYRLKMAVEDHDKKALDEQKHLLLAILEVIDNFERVLDAIEKRLENADRQTQNWVNSFKSIYKLLNRELREHGVTVIEAPDRRSAPGFHNVVETRENLDFDNGTILEEWKKGYLWRGRVLRLAEVVVVKN